MANTYTLIASSTVGSGGASSIDFTSIPSTYTDLVLKISARTTRSGQFSDAISLSINGVSTNQSSRYLEGSGAATGSGTLSSFRTQATGATATANTFGNSEYYIPNYAGSAHKSASSDGVSENNATDASAWLVANLWSSTAAINQLTITDLNSATFVQYSTAYLYGVKNA
jgi:hypothetical protein